MYVHYDPDEWKPVSSRRVCPYHQHNPADRAYAGCTCSSSFGQERRTPEEVAEIKARKRREHEDAVLAEAKIIEASRKRSVTKGHPQ